MAFKLKFRLTTLFFAIALAAVVAAWYSERCRFNNSVEIWRAEKQQMVNKFNADRLRLWSGVDTIASAESATHFLEQIDQQSVFDDSIIDQSEETANEIAVRELVKIWRNRSDVQHSIQMFANQYPELRNRNYPSEIGSEIWKHASVSSVKEFFVLAENTEFYGENTDAEEYDTLRDMIGELIKLVGSDK